MIFNWRSRRRGDLPEGSTPALLRRVRFSRKLHPVDRLAAMVWLFPLATAEPGLTASTWREWISPTLTVVGAVALVLVCLVAWATNLIALPGNWFAVATLAIYSLVGPADSKVTVGYVAVGLAFLAALIGELFEFLASAFGAKKAGASRRSTLYAMLGSMGGAMMGVFVGIPIPLIGPIVAAILFAGLGAAAGAMYGEWSDGRQWKENWSIGNAAFWGRTVGTIGKMVAGFAIVIIAVVAVLI